MKPSWRTDWPLLAIAAALPALAMSGGPLRSAAIQAAAGLATFSLAVVFLARGERFPTEARGWRWCAAGAFVLAFRWWGACVVGLVTHRPIPGWAIALSVPGNLLIVIGLLTLPIAPVGRAGRIRTFVEALLFGVSTLCLMWLAGVAELATFVALPMSSRALAIAPFFMNVTIMGVIVYLASPQPGRYLGTLGAVLGCVTAATVSNLAGLVSAAGPQGPQPLLQVVAVAALAILAWALARAGSIDQERFGQRLEPLGGLVPMLPTLGLVSVLFVRHATGGIGTELPLLWLVYPLVATLLVRQVLALEDLRLLSASREAKVAERSAALAEAQHQLQRRQRLEGLGRLAGGVAHDFNNLLTGISGCAHMIARRVPADSVAAAHAVEIRRAVERGAGLTRQILTFASRQPGRTQVIVPALIVEELAQMLGRVAGTELRLHVEPGAREARVRMDPAQLEQLIVNLTTNAREAMRAGGAVCITVGERVVVAGDAGTIDATPGRYVMISVADDGVGMTPEVMAHLFEPFFTTKPAGTGAGLGLATSYGLVRHARGFLTCESTVGRGTTMTVHLPVATAASGEAEPPARRATARKRAASPVADGAPRARPCVLLVDDEPVLRKTIAAALRDQGFAVLLASSGEEAVEIAEQHDGPLDVLVSDIVMPGMDGVATARAITAQRPGLPVILVSGFTDTPRDKLPPEFDFVAKPFAPPALIDRIVAALAARKAGEDQRS